MKGWKTFTGLLVIFISGILIGSALTGLYIRHQIRAKVRALISGDNQVAAEIVMNRLSRYLQLTSKQRTAIEPLIENATAQAGAIRQKLRPQFERVYLQTANSMKPYLTKEQQQRLDRLVSLIKKGLSEKDR